MREKIKEFGNVEVVEHEAHYHQRLFLEAWMSVKDPNAGNDHMVIPKSTNALHARKFSRVTRIQHAQRFNLKVFN